MPATVEICESNGAGETITHNITNANMGSVDSPNLNPVSYPIIAGQYSFEKYHRFHVTNMGGSASVRNLKVWMTGTLSGSDVLRTSATATNYAQKTYGTPSSSASSKATYVIGTSEPSGANVGISGSLSGEITAAGYSDYVVFQLFVHSSTTQGATVTLNYQYDEIA